MSEFKPTKSLRMITIFFRKIGFAGKIVHPGAVDLLLSSEKLLFNKCTSCAKLIIDRIFLSNHHGFHVVFDLAKMILPTT